MRGPQETEEILGPQEIQEIQGPHETEKIYMDLRKHRK